MNQHMEVWMDAYRDGELNERQIVRFEKHLETCPACLAQLEERESLSRLLQGYSLPESHKTTQQFVDDLKLVLPRAQTLRNKKQTMGMRWIIISIALLALLTFTQVVNWMSNVLQLIPGVQRLLDQAAALPAFLETAVPWVQLFYGQWFSFSGWGFLYASLTFTSIALTGILMLMYLSWLAFWGANHFFQQKPQTFLNQQGVK